MMDKRNNTSAFSKRFVMSKILRLGAWRDELRVLESMTSMAGTNVSNRARLFKIGLVGTLVVKQAQSPGS